MICAGTVGRVTIRSEKEAVRNTKGDLIQSKQRRLYAQFVSGGSPPEYVRQAALSALSFPGLPEHVDPLTQMTWFDSEVAARELGWDAEEKKYVEDWLHEHNSRGSYIVVEQPTVEPPFPNWVKQTKVHGQRKLEHVVADALRFVDEMGLDVGAIVAFESREQRQESQAIIDALTTPVPDAPQEQVVAA